jgi:hypothetical protein
MFQPNREKIKNETQQKELTILIHNHFFFNSFLFR